MESDAPTVTAQFYSSESASLEQTSLEDVNPGFRLALPWQPGEWTNEHNGQQYQIEEICAEIEKNEYKRIALQFPDAMLPDSASVSDAIEQRTGQKPFILADTSYGSCCVDEVAAEHGQADYIVHFGYACLSPVRGVMPARLVLPTVDLGSDDMSKLCSQLADAITAGKDLQKVILISDIPFQDCSDAIATTLLAKFADKMTIVQSQITLPGTCGHSSNEIDAQLDDHSSNPVKSIIILNRTARVPSFWLAENLANVWFLFIGHPESPLLTHLVMGYPQAAGHYCYNPADRLLRLEDMNVNRLLRKRLFLIEKAKDARLIGILVGTLGVANYLQILDRVKRCCRAAGKRFYVFSLGKLNVPKLANFAEIDIFVQISCPFQAILDSSDYHRPLITPFELEVACGAGGRGDWMAGPGWTANFTTLLEDDKSEVSITKQSPSNESDVSLITGHIRYNPVVVDHTDSSQSPTAGKEMISRDQALQVQAYTAGDSLVGRSWKGLEKNLEDNEPSEMEEGRSGIASGYANEPKS